ncbi:MAG: ACT domain-containing protein, partial [Verrucomicrobiia bacterium]
VRALMVFEDHNAMVVESDVLMIESDNRPGTLAEIAHTLSKAKVNIEYAYLATSPKARRGLCILRPSDVPKAMKALGASPR